MIAGFALGQVIIDTRVSLRAPSGLGVSGNGTVFAAGARGDRAGAESSYQSHCASCHGSGGKGDGWTAWFLHLKMRDLSDPAYLDTLSDDYLFQIVKHGGANLGKPGMPSWGLELTDGEIMGLVAYVRGLAAANRADQPVGNAP
jgi:mono/diheme cytochrome c family protein